MIYITGDTHGDFRRVETFCITQNTSKNDILIILGDAGINFHGWIHDKKTKDFIEGLPITLFCIHGNHEQRSEATMLYEEHVWNGGIVFIEEQYPDIMFAKDGEIFDIDGFRAVVIGGAYSVDKAMRLAYGYGWWDDEQPSPEIRSDVEKQLAENNWDIDVVLSHTTPLKYEPREVFLEGIDQSNVDKSTEIWLDEIEDKLTYQKWYCAHYHTAKIIDRIQIMYENFEEFRVD